jgi:drug/metabolite transporter (DMT)-like permease
MSVTAVMPPAASKKLSNLVWTAFLFICIVWGTTYLGVKVAVKYFPPFFLSGIRYSVSGAILLGWYFLRGGHLPTWSDVQKGLITGLLIIMGGNAILAWGIQFMPSGFSSIISVTSPIFITFISIYTFEGFRITPKILLGLLFCVAGIILLSSREDYEVRSTDLFWWGLGATLFANVTWSLGSVFMKKYPIEQPVFLKTGLQMLPGGLLNIAIGLTFERDVIFPIPTEGWFAVAYLTFVGSLLAFMAFVYLNKHMEPARLSIYSYVNTVVAVLVGWFFGEHLDIWMWVGIAIVLGGVWLVNKEYAVMSQSKQ